ncbi:coiled-coil domain-containing protein 114 isoform X2 [Cyprinodon tularosa]|uniref:coiled-coil domain-containing protein 114 isoform X2 n=1 Tax=Cyprinodon tularosa TaxID=77115 RepID=UPI0018E204D1|nr:coiled-coil domain-containing protein 114 isoform X2 [Cyprinodon tularosa]
MAERSFTMSGHSVNTNIDAVMEKAEMSAQLRKMKRDQKAYKTQTMKKISKQEQMIKNLLKEQEELRKRLAARGLTQQRKDSKDLQALLKQNETLDREIAEEKQRQKQLQMQILSTESKLADMKKERAVSSNPSQRLKAGRTVRNLEDRLHRATIKYNDMMTQNDRVKEEVDTLYRERDKFQKLRNNLTKEQQKICKSKDKIIKEWNAAHEFCEKARAEKKMLIEKDMKALAQYNKEVKELERVIAHDSKLNNFMSTKCKETESDFKEETKVNLGEHSLDNLKEVPEEPRSVLEDNPDLFDNIHIQAEDRNLALLKVITEQKAEAEKLKVQIRKVTEEMEKFHCEASQSKASLLKDMEPKLEETRSQAETYENEAVLLSELLDKVKTGVDSIFSEMCCDQSAVKETPGCSSEITENHTIICLSLINEKINELTLQAFLPSKEKDSNQTDLTKSLQDRNAELLEQDFTTLPSVSSLEHDAEEPPVSSEDERPLSRECLRRKIIKHIP